MTIHYTVIKSDTLQGLISGVNHAIREEGYETVGGMSVSISHASSGTSLGGNGITKEYCQAMILKDKDEAEKPSQESDWVKVEEAELEGEEYLVSNGIVACTATYWKAIGKWVCSDAQIENGDQITHVIPKPITLPR
jgi:hypothetical protein